MTPIHSFGVGFQFYRHGNKVLRPQFSRPLFKNLMQARHFASTPEKSKFRRFYEQYGKLGIGVYLGISVISVSSIYTAVRLGFDFKSLLERFNLQDNSLVSKAGPFALAYGIHKLLAPARLLLAIVLTPLIKRRFLPNK